MSKTDEAAKVESERSEKENPILTRVLAEVKRATEGAPANTSGHSSYVSGVFEPDAE